MGTMAVRALAVGIWVQYVGMRWALALGRMDEALPCFFGLWVRTQDPFLSLHVGLINLGFRG